jgi:hypothetical protein
MKRFLLLAILAGAQAFAAAPDSVAGKVFRLYTSFSGRPDTSESTIVLGTDGRYVYLKYAIGVLPSPVGGYHGVLALQAPLADGTFTFTRTGDSNGTLGLVGDDGARRSFDLIFTSLTAGNLAGGFAGLNPFYLTDLAAAQTAPISNISLRGQVAPNRPLVAGFVVPGTQEREVLIRVVGPSLAQFGVSGTWADPEFAIYQGNGLRAYVRQSYGGDWCATPNGSSVSPEAALRKIFNYVGDFPLVSGSRDAAEVVRLAPGAYTLMTVAAPGDTGGEALIEVYFLP